MQLASNIVQKDFAGVFNCTQGGYSIMESVLYAQYIVATCHRHGQILRLQRH
jgi:hypothetical protein